MKLPHLRKSVEANGVPHPEQVPFVVYYSKVVAEVAKIVFRGQKMNPP